MSKTTTHIQILQIYTANVDFFDFGAEFRKLKFRYQADLTGIYWNYLKKGFDEIDYIYTGIHRKKSPDGLLQGVP